MVWYSVGMEKTEHVFENLIFTKTGARAALLKNKKQ